MAFLKPQLASPTDSAFPLGLHSVDWSKWVMEEKLDGHRLIVEVEPGLSSLLSEAKHVTAWSRNGKPRALPTHLNDALGQLPVGIYDGELLVPGHRSYDVTELVNSDRLCYVAFDILEAERVSVRDTDLMTRRMLLDLIFRHPAVEPNKFVQLAEQRKCGTIDAVEDWRDEVWARDGEGLILKHVTSHYIPGKRSKAWVKIKQLRSAVLTVTGWQSSRGKVNDRGQWAIAILTDDEGHQTTVKTPDDETIAQLNREAMKNNGRPPFVGRRLRIEYQERTPDGLYRHPRWDRWNDE